MTKILYRPLATGIKSADIAHLRSNTSSTMRQYWSSSTKTRNSLAFVTIVFLVIVYVIWSSSTATSSATTVTSSTIANNGDGNYVIANDSMLVCSENFSDTRQYIQNRRRQSYANLTTIYFITPTYPRREQIPELTRLAHTMMHIPQLHWLVANDLPRCNVYLDDVLNKFGIPFTHLSSPMPDMYRHVKDVPRGVANRRAALLWLRQRNITNGVLYFGDDDNTFDLKLFSEIRDTRKVSMFPVGLIGEYAVSGPVVKEGKVVGFFDSWTAKRRWPVDMAGFAVNLAYLAEHANATMPYTAGYEEDLFLRSIGLQLDFIEPKANNCTEILVWHTRTQKGKSPTIQIKQTYLDDRSNLGALFKELQNMGISHASENEGIKATISKNGKPKPINYFLR